ncbi:MAG: glycerophosphoryl diester phosphodiesterase [Flavobacteriales bacterium]|jgi:glycerophosphoryl diester phosphodiesterase
MSELFNSRPYKIVGHRGLMGLFPENTSLGCIAAIKGGADAIEIDVQLSSDGRVFVVHDTNLLRTGSVDCDVLLSESNKILNHQVGDIDRFGADFSDCQIETLEGLCEKIEPLMAGKQIFIEIKTQSILAFGAPYVLDKIESESRVLGNRRVFISFSKTVLRLAQLRGYAIGYIVNTYDEKTQEYAKSIQPDYIIGDILKLPESGKFDGPWRWFVYDVVDKEVAEKLFERGCSYIESKDFSALLL